MFQMIEHDPDEVLACPPAQCALLARAIRQAEAAERERVTASERVSVIFSTMIAGVCDAMADLQSVNEMDATITFQRRKTPPEQSTTMTAASTNGD